MPVELDVDHAGPVGGGREIESWGLLMPGALAKEPSPTVVTVRCRFFVRKRTQPDISLVSGINSLEGICRVSGSRAPPGEIGVPNSRLCRLARAGRRNRFEVWGLDLKRTSGVQCFSGDLLLSV